MARGCGGSIIQSTRHWFRKLVLQCHGSAGGTGHQPSLVDFQRKGLEIVTEEGQQGLGPCERRGLAQADPWTWLGDRCLAGNEDMCGQGKMYSRS